MIKDIAKGKPNWWKLANNAYGKGEKGKRGGQLSKLEKYDNIFSHKEVSCVITECNKWVEQLMQQLAKGKQFRRLIQQCIINMGEDKKLYKYYDVDAEHTLGNIYASINYYNNPVAFNDPFDCNVGISSDQLIRVLLPDLFDQIYQPTIDPSLKQMIETIMFGDEIKWSERTDADIISDCVNNTAFNSLVFRAKAGEVIDETELFSFLTDNPDVLFSIVKRYSQKGENAFQKEDVARVVSHSTGFLREAIKRESENNSDEIKQVISILDEPDDFLKKVSKIAHLMGRSVPDEQIDQLYIQLNEMVKKLHQGIGDTVGITCFSETPFNMLMWSHYANKHSGICVEYDFSKLFSTVPNSLLLPVEYTNKRPLLPVEMVVVSRNGSYEWDQSKIQMLLPALLKSLAIKSEIWSYEREWRHIIFTKDIPNRLACLPIISKIILGINISPENREKVLTIAKEKGIPVYIASMKSDKYEMVWSKLE